jgi:folate-binding protein YgfZ
MVKAYLLGARSLLRLRGEDKVPFLQGLLSNDVSKINAETSIFALLLSPQGRIQFDLILSQLPGQGEDEGVGMEVDQDRAEALLNRLALFKLRSQVTLDLVQDRSILALWGDGILETLGLPNQPGATKTTPLGTAFVDPRLPALGVRLIGKTGAMDEVQRQLGATLCDEPDYRRHRYALGVPEGDNEIEVDRAIPLEWGMDDLNGISWDKGCYMGQELTARTRYRGLVRKRIFPAFSPAFRSGSIADKTLPISHNNTPVGRWIVKEKEGGLALVEIAAADQELQWGEEVVRLERPHWMRLME